MAIERIIIVGGGTAGWMAAAAISRVLGKTLDVTLVESEEIGTVGVGEATIPTLLSFHRMIDINEQAYMSAVQGTIKLGISFENWLDVGHRYIHSFGVNGKDHWSAGFQHFWLRGRRQGLASDYGDYCVELKAAERDRFAHLPRSTNLAPDWARWQRQTSTAFANLEQRFGENWLLRVNTAYTRGNVQNVRLYGTGNPDPVTGAGNAQRPTSASRPLLNSMTRSCRLVLSGTSRRTCPATVWCADSPSSGEPYTWFENPPSAATSTNWPSVLW